jgi:Leucine-rich repeat (LRR) protein
MPASPAPHPWRKYLRFSVRGLIVLVLLIGGGLGWIVRKAHIQRNAVAAIQEAGGSFRYNFEWYGGKSIPEWLIDLFGADYLGQIAVVDFSSSASPTDATLAHVGRLTGLQLLDVDSPSVGDAGLAHLKGLSNLSTLMLSGTQVTDAGLVHLKGLSNLSTLVLNGTKVTDAGLAHLKGLTGLSSLYLTDTQVTDSGLIHLKGLTNLSHLNLENTHITDAGLAHLKGLTKLRQLWVQNTQVSDAGVNALNQALPSLWINPPEGVSEGADAFQ